MSTPQEFAAQTVAYVQHALGVLMEYDQATLPVLDHYLRDIPKAQSDTLRLMLATAGAYFGEVLIREIGGRWEISGEQPTDWRVVLTSGISVCPAGLVAANVAGADVSDFDCEIEAPAAIREIIEKAMSSMSDVTEEEYFSLAGRFDTLQHLHEVVVGVAAQKIETSN